MTHCKDYIECVGTEAELRERGEVLDVDAFTALRRENSAIRLCFGLFEYALGFDLPDEVFENEAFMELYFAGCDLVCWANVSQAHLSHPKVRTHRNFYQSQDLYSYDMELAKGHRGNNIITVLMESQRFSLQDAADNVGVHFAELMQAWSAAQLRLPSWGAQIDADVAKYIEATGHWIRGNLECVHLTHFDIRPPFAHPPSIAAGVLPLSDTLAPNILPSNAHCRFNCVPPSNS